MNDSGATAVAAPRDIPAALEGIERQIAILQKVVDDVVSKIEPALRPQPPAAPSGAKNSGELTPARAPIAERLHGYISALTHLRTKLDEASSRIQL